MVFVFEHEHIIDFNTLDSINYKQSFDKQIFLYKIYKYIIAQIVQNDFDIFFGPILPNFKYLFKKKLSNPRI